MRFPLFLLPVAAIAASSAAASPRLLSPSNGSAVRPGDTVMITVGEAPRGAEEWEAFLSPDGGKTYPIRITPHLPIHELSFAWTVPTLPTSEARVRVRFGAGGVEKEFALPETFSIGLSSRGALLDSGCASAVGAVRSSGEEETLAWVDRTAGQIRLIVPPFSDGMAPVSRWSSSPRPWRAVPRNRIALAPPDDSVRPDRSDALPLLAAHPAPYRRSLASLSRLNV